MKGKQNNQRVMTSFDAPPLDFANQNIRSLNDLKGINPRQGKRKPIMANDMEDNKDGKKKTTSDQIQTEANQQQNTNQTQGQAQGQVSANQEEQQDKGGEEEEKEKERERKEKEKIKEQRGVPSIIRTIAPNQISFVMAQSQAQNSGTKGIQAKLGDETSNQEQNGLVKVKLIQSSLVLSYNKISHLSNFYSVVDSIMYDCKNLQWIDLAHNYLETLDYDFSDFQLLKSLYLHGNYLKDLKDLQQLGNLKSLRNLTIHGNPVDTIPSFRLYIIGMLPKLVKLDSVLISKKELDNTLVWKHNFHMITPPQPRIITRPLDSQE